MTRMMELRQQLMADLGQTVAPYGFSYRVSRQLFVRNETFGRSFYIPWCTHYGGECFLVAGHVAIRHDVVEDLRWHVYEAPNPRHERQSVTVTTELGNLSEGRRKEWTVWDETGLEPAVRGLGAILELVGLPWYEGYADLEAVYGALCDDRAWKGVTSGRLSRSINAVAIAYVLGRHDDLYERTQHWHSYLVDLDELPVNVALYDRMADHIRAKLAAGPR